MGKVFAFRDERKAVKAPPCHSYPSGGSDAALQLPPRPHRNPETTQQPSKGI